MNTTANNKIAIVTGASSGIGKACALGLLQDGWTVVLVGRREAALQDTVTAAGAHAERAIAMPVDLTQEDAVRVLFDAVQHRFGRLDLLFNNAGMSLPFARPHELAGQDWRRMFDINLNGAF